MTSFTQMAGVLSAAHVPVWTGIDEPIPAGLSRTERIRRLLKASSRPVTAAEIAWDMADHFPNFGSGLVWLLLKYEIEKGRVLFINGKYSWSHAYESAEAKEIRRAMKLLKRAGYQIKPPKDAP